MNQRSTAISLHLGFINYQTWLTFCLSFAQTHRQQLEASYLIDQHYPLRPEVNRPVLKHLCERFNYQYIDSLKDRGAAQGFNYALSQLPKTTHIVTYDPDMVPATDNALERQIAVLDANPSLAFVSLAPAFCADALYMQTRADLQIIANERVWVMRPNKYEMMDGCVWRRSFLDSVNGFTQQFRYYGQLEIPMIQLATKQGLTWGYLADHGFIVDQRYYDAEYTQWKHAHIAGFTGSMSEWLASH